MKEYIKIDLGYIDVGDFPPSSVKEIIEKLQKLPQYLPCYIRPKYFGTIKPYYDVPINVKGISKMEPFEDGVNKEHITFLV